MTKTAKSTHKLIITSFIIFVIIGSVLLFAGWFYIFTLSQKLNKIESEIVNLQQESELLADLNIKYAYVADDKEMVLESMPNSKEISSFLATIEQIAINNNLTIQEDSIGEASKKKKIADLQLRQTVGKENYYKLRNEYHLKNGKYENILNFIKEVDSLRRVVTIESVKLIATEGSDDPGGADLLANIVLNVYIKK